ncbi:hypothetical protein ABIF38_004004 [Bradyrhizobium japonicum]|jgi:hypothetical protein|uniref:Clp R domain-containing protein n=1 Tax=Bradyrhizobium elkanii TaxID=29448 RepID=A0A8I1Y594_BRAEL|nr:hypothetical protein [Bradyrhizobium elkanii]MCS4011803.1 hypothetical protein [Bradyrhizobium elkanii USDA 61]MCP1733678.1 hypothetical protein [Bradyrhizobium elkanii]MCP1751354.1 hypothetical protein [Bradyrhizobium elkanii]MCP1924729.1 hypothetical protein [Bradyrhizobium elkanii]
MFKGIGSKLNDMGTIKFLCERAETYALQDQQREPGAEHFLLASLDLPDGTWAGGARCPEGRDRTAVRRSPSFNRSESGCPARYADAGKSRYL